MSEPVEIVGYWNPGTDQRTVDREGGQLQRRIQELGGTAESVVVREGNTARFAAVRIRNRDNMVELHPGQTVTRKGEEFGVFDGRPEGVHL